MNEHVRPAEFHAISTGRMDDLAPGFAALDTWTRPACLRKRCADELAAPGPDADADDSEARAARPPRHCVGCDAPDSAAVESSGRAGAEFDRPGAAQP